MSKKITVSKAIGEALHEEMLRDDKMFIMGEDMAVMGNVFAITRGFLEEFGPNRVIDTPISEEGFVGMAVGAAMRGMLPVVELMYDDFATECADPLQPGRQDPLYDWRPVQCSHGAAGPYGLRPPQRRPALPIPGELLLPFPWPEGCGSPALPRMPRAF